MYFSHSNPFTSCPFFSTMQSQQWRCIQLLYTFSDWFFSRSVASKVHFVGSMVVFRCSILRFHLLSLIASFVILFFCNLIQIRIYSATCFLFIFSDAMSSRLPYGVILDEDALSNNPPNKWKRVLLKISGEALAGDCTQNIDPKVRFIRFSYITLNWITIFSTAILLLNLSIVQVTMSIAREVASVIKLGIEV